MKTDDEIRDRIARVEADSRYDPADPATVTVNAPLALQQTSMEARVNALRWVLGESAWGGGEE